MLFEPIAPWSSAIDCCRLARGLATKHTNEAFQPYAMLAAPDAFRQGRICN